MHYVCKNFWANVEENEDGVSVWEVYTGNEPEPSATYKGLEFHHWTPWGIYVRRGDIIRGNEVQHHFYMIDEEECNPCEKDPRPNPALLFIDTSLRKWSVTAVGVKVGDSLLPIPCTTRPIIADYYEIGIAMDDTLYVLNQKNLFQKLMIRFSEPISSFVLHDTMIEVGMDKGALLFHRNIPGDKFQELGGIIHSI